MRFSPLDIKYAELIGMSFNTPTPRKCTIYFFPNPSGILLVFLCFSVQLWPWMKAWALTGIKLQSIVVSVMLSLSLSGLYHHQLWMKLVYKVPTLPNCKLGLFLSFSSFFFNKSFLMLNTDLDKIKWVRGSSEQQIPTTCQISWWTSVYLTGMKNLSKVCTQCSMF